MFPLMRLSPIVFFVYNRPFLTLKSLKSLKNNVLSDQSRLYIFSDGPKETATENEKNNIEKVREIIHSLKWCNHVFIEEAETNKGLANSQIEGITQVINEYGKVIVLEDDLVFSPYFLKFMNEGLNYYEDDHNIISITGTGFSPEYMKKPTFYKHDVYLSYRTNSTGWGTWLDRWNMVDWEMNYFDDFIKSEDKIKKLKRGGEDLFDILNAQKKERIDSWAIRWAYTAAEYDKYCVYPFKSYTTNIGFGKDSTHTKGLMSFLVNDIDEALPDVIFTDLKVNRAISKQIRDIFQITVSENYTTKMRRIIVKGIKKVGLYNFFKKLR